MGFGRHDGGHLTGLRRSVLALGAECCETALEGLGTTWQVEALSYKFHACLSWIACDA